MEAQPGGVPIPGRDRNRRCQQELLPHPSRQPQTSVLRRGGSASPPSSAQKSPGEAERPLPWDIPPCPAPPGSFVPRDAPGPPRTQVLPEPRARCSRFPVLHVLPPPGGFPMPSPQSPSDARCGPPPPLLLSSLLSSSPLRPVPSLLPRESESAAGGSGAPRSAAPGPLHVGATMASSISNLFRRSLRRSGRRGERWEGPPGRREPGGAGMRTGSAARSHRHRFGPLQPSPSLCHGAHPESRGLSLTQELTLNPRGLSILSVLILSLGGSPQTSGFIPGPRVHNALWGLSPTPPALPYSHQPRPKPILNESAPPPRYSHLPLLGALPQRGDPPRGATSPMAAPQGEAEPSMVAVPRYPQGTVPLEDGAEFGLLGSVSVSEMWVRGFSPASPHPKAVLEVLQLFFFFSIQWKMKRKPFPFCPFGDRWVAARCELSQQHSVGRLGAMGRVVQLLALPLADKKLAVSVGSCVCSMNSSLQCPHCGQGAVLQPLPSPCPWEGGVKIHSWDCVQTEGCWCPPDLP